MRCDEVRRYLGPYLDSELDAKTSFEMARHLEACEDCRARLEAEDRLEKAIVGELRRPEPGDDALWERARARAERPRRRAWLWAAALLVGLAGAAGIFLSTRGASASLADVLLQDYLKFQAGRSPLEIGSPDAAAVERYFKDKMGMALTVAPEVGEMKLEGGRKCSLRGAPTAFLVYRCGEERVSVAIFNADQLDRFPSAVVGEEPRAEERGELRVTMLRSGWKVVCATGPVSLEDLLELCAAYRDAEDRRR